MTKTSQQHLEELQATFRSGKTRSYEWRAQQLKNLIRCLDENEDRFIEVFKKDSGKAEFTTFAGEILFVRSEANHALKNLKKWMKPKRVSSPMALMPLSSKVQATPYGVMLIGVAWNFPLHLSLGPLSAAIAAGNCVLIKPPSMSPAFCELIEELMPKYFDQDAIRVFQPEGEERDALLQQPFDLILYTGSPYVGKVVMRAAAENLTPVLLELGGKNPCIVHQSVNIDAAANRIVDAKFLNAGQVCVTADYLLVHESIKDKFVQALKEKVLYMYGDNPEESHSTSCIINQHHFERLSKLFECGDVVVGGTTNPETRFIAPTVLDNVSIDSEIMQDEIFGPILPVISYQSDDEIFSIIQRYGKPLCLYVFGEDKTFNEKIINNTESGSVGINSIMLHMPNHKLPFGGVGQSGMGQYHGKHGFDSMSHMRPIVSKPTWLDLKQAYPPFDSEEIVKLKKAMRFLMR